MEVVDIAKTISDLGLAAVSIAALIVVWKEYKQERVKRDEQSEKVNESFMKMTEVITANTDVLDRVNNFIRDERGDN